MFLIADAIQDGAIAHPTLQPDKQHENEPKFKQPHPGEDIWLFTICARPNGETPSRCLSACRGAKLLDVETHVMGLCGTSPLRLVYHYVVH